MADERTSRGKILVTGIHVFAFHGVLPEERRDGQDFYVDVELDCDMTAAVASDDIADALDYAQVVADVHGITHSETFNLIESLAARLGRHLLGYAQVERVLVRVHKPEAPVPHHVTDIAVELAFERDADAGPARC